MGKGFGLFAAVAAAVLLTPYKVEIDKENNTYNLRSLLLDVTVKNEKNAETAETTHHVDVKLAGKPTKEDIETLKTNVSNVAAEGVKKAKEAAEKAKDFAVKAKEKFTGSEEAAADGEDGTAEDAETADAGDFCTDEEAAKF